VPGCRNAAFLDLHHVQPRSEGGGNEVDNLITLCGAHHRAAHRGQLGVTGGVARGIHFHHSDGSAYGSVVSPSLSATREKAFAALRALGFREREVTCALADSTLSEHGPSLTLDHILRQALERLTAAAYR
jgi:Holliday junction resolvasome RuvABC DNA-binding subunit